MHFAQNQQKLTLRALLRQSLIKKKREFPNNLQSDSLCGGDQPGFVCPFAESSVKLWTEGWESAQAGVTRWLDAVQNHFFSTYYRRWLIAYILKVQEYGGDTSRKGNLRTLRSTEDCSGITERSKSTFSNSFVGVPDVGAVSNCKPHRPGSTPRQLFAANAKRTAQNPEPS